MLLESVLLRNLSIGETKAYVQAKPMPYLTGSMSINQETYAFTLDTTCMDHGMILKLASPATKNYRAATPLNLAPGISQTNQYITYEAIVVGNSLFATNVFSVTVDLGAKYGSTSPQIVGKSMLFTYDYAVQVKFNDLINGDIWKLTPVTPGVVESFTFGLDELGISTIYLAAQIPSGSAHDINVRILVTG